MTVVRPLTVFGYDDAPEGHCEVLYEEVRLGEECIVGGWGRGFEVRTSRDRDRDGVKGEADGVLCVDGCRSFKVD